MRYLIISDIHGNLDALEACLADALGLYDQILCLGDLVGYGADPNAVVDWCRANANFVIRGNHDKAVAGIGETEDFNDQAASSVTWTTSQLSPENLSYLRALPAGPVRVNGFTAVHGSPSDEDEYILSGVDAMRAFTWHSGTLTFFGHTHVQGGFLWKSRYAHPISPLRPNQDARDFPLQPDTAYLINPGSIGQPRDHDPRAAYALYDSDQKLLTYRRVEYDVAKAQRRILASGLPEKLALRLSRGL